jgi:hypothetical protein
LADAALAGGATHGPGGDDGFEVAKLFQVHGLMLNPKTERASDLLGKFADAEVAEIDG